MADECGPAGSRPISARSAGIVATANKSFTPNSEKMSQQ